MRVAGDTFARDDKIIIGRRFVVGKFLAEPRERARASEVNII